MFALIINYTWVPVQGYRFGLQFYIEILMPYHKNVHFKYQRNACYEIILNIIFVISGINPNFVTKSGKQTDHKVPVILTT